MAEKILILSGSKSDAEIVKKITDVLDEFKVEYKCEVASAHRNPEKVEKLVKSTFAEAIIAVAGLSAALPGVVASHTLIPVIGVPVSSKLSGLDALLSIVQMPPGGSGSNSRNRQWEECRNPRNPDSSAKRQGIGKEAS